MKQASDTSYYYGTTRRRPGVLEQSAASYDDASTSPSHKTTTSTSPVSPSLSPRSRRRRRGKTMSPTAVSPRLVALIASTLFVVVSVITYYGVFFFIASTTTSSSIDPIPSNNQELRQQQRLRGQRLGTNKNETTTTSATDEYQNHHNHAIPNVVIFTHAVNLLETTFDFAADTEDTQLSPEQTELLALQANVKNILTNLHDTATVRFLTDDDCIQSIRAVFAETNDTVVADELVNYFVNEKAGMFKADLCRGAALWQSGGLYFDVDLGVRMNLWNVIRENTEFVTVRVHRQSKYPGAFFQAFIGVTPHHAVIRRYIELFLDYYRGEISIKGPLGVLLLKRAYDEIEAEQQQEEVSPAAQLTGNDHTNMMTTQQPVNTHLNQTTEIWQEVLYLPELQHTLLSHVPPPDWGGTKRACHFIVLSG